MTQRDTTFLRFFVVGGSLAAIYAVLAALATTWLPLPRALSAGTIWVLCIPLGFLGQRHYTFTTRNVHRHGLLLYAAIQVLGLGIASGVSFLLSRGQFWHDLAVHLFASVLAAIASYLINRWIVFPKPSKD